MSSQLTTILLWAFGTGLFSAFATGLGVIPVAMIGEEAQTAKAWASGLAAGMMIWASLETIGLEAWALSPVLCLVGAGLGALFLVVLERWLPSEGKTDAGWMLWLVMLIHSFPEGLAIGVGFATGNLSFGILLALVISLHNVPEGLAISLAMRADGAKLGKCFCYSVYSSLPQPLVAVPAALFAAWAQPLIAPGLGFAGGAMLMVAGREMVPQSLSSLGRWKALVSVFLGCLFMAFCTYLLEQLPMP